MYFTFQIDLDINSKVFWCLFSNVLINLKKKKLVSFLYRFFLILRKQKLS